LLGKSSLPTLQNTQIGSNNKADLEYLQDDRGRRVAAFGYHAGFAGAALALECWAWQLTHKDEKFPSVSSYNNENALVIDVKKAVAQGMEKTGKAPRVLVVSNPAYLRIPVSGLCAVLEHCLRCGIVRKLYRSYVNPASRTLS
jgi:hypothetical protein